MSHPHTPDPTAPLDLLIHGGTVVDGTGSAAVHANVGIRHGRLVFPVRRPAPPAAQTIDAAGLFVAPGFIDIHSHSDFTALIYPRADSKALAGVTTDVSGNCGYSAFPLTAELQQRRRLEYDHLGLKIDWLEPADYFARAESTPSSVNRILLVGHGNLRAAVLGHADQRATRDQLNDMVKRTEQAFAAGAWGLSSGLIYAPGCFADRDELTALARVAASHGRYYASHIRGEGATVLQAVDEFLAVLHDSGAPGQLSHVKVAGQRNWHLFGALKTRLFQARQTGADFLADRYPYTASSTDLASLLLPDWARAGTVEQILTRLADAATRARIEQEAPARLDPDFANQIMVCHVHHKDWQHAVGKRLAQLAADHKATPLQAALDLILADQAQTTSVSFSMNEQQLQETLTWPFVMIGSDGSIRDGTGPDCPQRCHPRTYGTPARLLGTYVRQLGLLNWSQAIFKMTHLPAQALSLTDRGRIADGLAADLVLFDPQTIEDRATYQHPAMAPAGIEHVIVNGQPVVRHAQHTSQYPGRVLRHD
jgi:N-acyl-D-amino-acid deacylase